MPAHVADEVVSAVCFIRAHQALEGHRFLLFLSLWGDLSPLHTAIGAGRGNARAVVIEVVIIVDGMQFGQRGAVIRQFVHQGCA